jgi:hypothetical protein
VNVVCCQVEVSETVRSLVQKSHTEFAVSVCHLETSKMWPGPEWGFALQGKETNMPMSEAERVRKQWPEKFQRMRR